MPNENIKKAVYSVKLKIGRRTYFFDVKENADGDKYLVITESKLMTDDTFRRDRIMIFENSLVDFNNTLKDVLDYLGQEDK